MFLSQCRRLAGRVFVKVRPNAEAKALVAYRQHAAARAAASPQMPPTGDPVVLTCVYRKRNRPVVEAMLRQCPADVDARLWCLDGDPGPGTRLGTGRVLGAGPGEKFPLVDALLACRPLPENAYVVVADDDVVFSQGSLEALLRVCRHLSLDLAQPAQSWSSCYSHPFTLARPWSLARRTGFVEIGPLFVVGPGRRSDFIPFGPVGMGYGLEMRWNTLAKSGARLGIVDRCQMVHLGTVGAGYAVSQELERMVASLPGQDYGALADTKQVDCTYLRLGGLALQRPKPVLPRAA